ncbi:MAG: hypothetical protein ABL951_14695 [Alphaproteobacteria bacterium]
MNNNIRKLEKEYDLIESYEFYQAQVQGTNINARTLLATDYLNHFNEIIMLVEMISDMPECIEDVAAWSPKNYQDHFRESSFAHRDLAVAAYDYVPALYRVPFERLISELNILILKVVATVLDEQPADNKSETGAAALLGPELRMLIEKAGGVINGEHEGTDQTDIDAMLRF